MDKIRILIISDNRLLRKGINGILEKQTGLSVETAPGNGENIIRIISAQQSDVLLMDVDFPKHDNIEFMISLQEKYPEVKIILMGLIPRQEEILQFIEVGVSGFILKDASIDDLLKTIQSVAKGKKVLPVKMIKSVFSLIVDHGMEKYGESKLVRSVRMTNREREVVALIADGLTNKEIAQNLNISYFTVKSHVHNILHKLALNNRLQIANYAHSEENLNTIGPQNPQ